MGNTSGSSAENLIEKIKYGNCYNGQKTREIYRKAWKGMNSTELTDAALSVLEKHGIIRRNIEFTGGRPSESILINPNFGGAV